MEGSLHMEWTFLILDSKVRLKNSHVKIPSLSVRWILMKGNYFKESTICWRAAALLSLSTLEMEFYIGCVQERKKSEKES